MDIKQSIKDFSIEELNNKISELKVIVVKYKDNLDLQYHYEKELERLELILKEKMDEAKKINLLNQFNFLY